MLTGLTSLWLLISFSWHSHTWTDGWLWILVMYVVGTDSILTISEVCCGMSYFTVSFWSSVRRLTDSLVWSWIFMELLNSTPERSRGRRRPMFPRVHTAELKSTHCIIGHYVISKTSNYNSIALWDLLFTAIVFRFPCELGVLPKATS